MKFQLGAMTVGDILDRGLKMLLSNLVAFYLINLIVLSPIIIFMLAVPSLTASLENQGSPLQLGPLLGILVAFLLFIILQPIGTAAVIHMISQDYIDQPVSMGSAVRFALGRFGSLLATSILMGLVLFAGFIMCLVPGIIFYVWFVFFAQIVVVEGLTGTSALSRSKTLTVDFRGRVFGLLVLFSVIGFVFQFASGLMQQFLPSFELVPVPKRGQFDLGFKQVVIYPNYWINTIVAQLVSILVQTYSAVCVTLLYFDLRNRKEGFDLEMAARAEQPAPQP